MRSDFLASTGQKPEAKRVAARIHGLRFFVIAMQREPVILGIGPVLRHKPECNPRLKDDEGCPT